MNERISAFLAERIAANDFPSAVYLVAENGEIVFHDALGNAVVEPEIIPARLNTIYDLASLTKPLVTGLLAARYIENGIVDLEDDVARFVRNDKLPHDLSVSLRELATHTSGFQAWKPFYLVRSAPQFDPDDYGCASRNNDEIREFVQVEIFRSQTERRDLVVYSDLNFLLLGFLIEILSGSPLNAMELETCERLGLKRTFCGGTGTRLHETAASELGNEYEKQTCIEKGYLPSQEQRADLEGGLNINGDSYALANARASANLRTRQIWGEVHDGNAYFMGGVAGHAGLFSTAEEVFKIALQFLPEHTKLLKPATCELFRTNFTPGMNEDRSFAFQLASTQDSTAGTRMSPESFGHNGFTGTSLWIDPVMDRIFVLLTNRTHAHPLPFVNINSVRRRFHDLAIEELERS